MEETGSGPGANPARPPPIAESLHFGSAETRCCTPGHATAKATAALQRRGLAATTHAVRLVCFGDIHMALGAIARLADELRSADVAIVTGDITNFGDPPDAARVIDAVRAHCPNVLAVTGNLDMPWVIDALAAAGVSLHGEARRFGDLGIFGCGGSNVTPMDTPTEFEEHELGAVLERAHAAVADAPRRLMICHTPPFETRLDRLRNGTPVGSPTVRAFIEAVRPDLAIVGHIHEGRGIDRVGDTTVVNPGALRDGGYVVVEYDEASGTLRPELRCLERRLVL
jgi:Icc-related predicted phosphoesterase